jgi:hypothetical protein
MDALPPTASHRHLLERELGRLPKEPTVIEHGVGMFSSLVIADHLRKGRLRNLIVIEAHPGWRAWADWMYYRALDVPPATVKFVDAQRDVDELELVDLVFIDGAAHERVKLLNRALLAGVRQIVMHDTEPGQWKAYDLRPHFFSHPGYEVEHHLDGERRTTVWREAWKK